MLAATEPYLELVKKVPLRPIESDQELDIAIATIDSLLAKPSLSRDEDDYLDVLGDLVYKYERTSQPIEPVADSVMLRHLMAAKTISRVELHRGTGIPVSTIAAVLQGKRSLSREQVAALSAFFRVAPNVFALPQNGALQKKAAIPAAQARRRSAKARKTKETRG